MTQVIPGTNGLNSHMEKVLREGPASNLSSSNDNFSSADASLGVNLAAPPTAVPRPPPPPPPCLRAHCGNAPLYTLLERLKLRFKATLESNTRKQSHILVASAQTGRFQGLGRREEDEGGREEGGGRRQEGPRRKEGGGREEGERVEEVGFNRFQPVST